MYVCMYVCMYGNQEYDSRLNLAIIEKEAAKKKKKEDALLRYVFMYVCMGE